MKCSLCLLLLPDSHDVLFLYTKIFPFLLPVKYTTPLLVCYVCILLPQSYMAYSVVESTTVHSTLMKTKVSLGHWPTFWFLFHFSAGYNNNSEARHGLLFLCFISLSFGPPLLVGDKEQDIIYTLKLLSKEKLGLQGSVSSC